MLKDWVYLLIDPLRRQFVSMLKDRDYLPIDPFTGSVLFLQSEAACSVASLKRPAVGPLLI